MKIALIFLIMITVALLGVYFIRLPKPKSLFEPLSLQEAQAIAEKYLGGDRHEMTVQPELTQEFEFGFVFYYVPKKFIETRNPRDLIPGISPLVVDRRDRKAHPLSSELDGERAIEAYKENWHSN